MLLYHGTTEEAWRSIKADGQVKGRGLLGTKGQWNHTVISHPQCVYLTECYAGYFAMNAVGEQSRIALLEFNTEHIEFRLVPDEDALEKMTVGASSSNSRTAMYKRTKEARKRLHKYIGTPSWRDSLELLGTCAHFGPLGLEALSRVALLDVREAKHLCWEWMQPSITPANRKYCTQKYLELTQLSFTEGQGVEVIDMRKMLTAK